jgi:broad specificity phosphatase PhoE
LRELNFGEHEGLHFDGLTDQEKLEISDPDYQAPGGENWEDVRQRTIEYFGGLSA